MKFFGIWTIFVALSISIVAAYYSIVGLSAIFAAALIPIIIMGTVLEIGKITTAIWLHLNWDTSPFLMKTYLTIATVVLMFITSMGIFGFLSKAHVEQNLVSSETAALLDSINFKIENNQQEITNYTSEIETLEQSTDIKIERIREQIAAEQDRIDRTIERIRPSIESQQQIIDAENKRKEELILPLNDELEIISQQISNLVEEKDRIENQTVDQKNNQEIETELVNLNRINEEIQVAQVLSQNPTKENIEQLQRLIGVDDDGIFGRDTREKLTEYVTNKQQQVQQSEQKIDELRSYVLQETNRIDSEKQKIPTITSQINDLRAKESEIRKNIQSIVSVDDERTVAARNEIQRIQLSLEQEILNNNKIIENLRAEASVTTDEETIKKISELQKNISTLKTEISEYNAEKFRLESSIRQLEAEVGPIKYISDMVYGNSDDKDSLERAVRWVILLIIFVFDPLAIILVIAGISIISKKEVKTDIIENSPTNQTPKKRGRPRKSEILTKSVEIHTDIQNNDLTNEVETDILTKNKRKKNGWLD